MTDQQHEQTGKPPTPNQAALEAVWHTRDAALATNEAVAQLQGHYDRLARPADLQTVIIDPAAGSADTAYGRAPTLPDYSPSFGVLNPNDVPVLLGIGGNTPRTGARVPSVPPEGLLVLPLAVGELDLGIDAASLGASTAVVYVFRYHTVQPAFLGVR